MFHKFGHLQDHKLVEKRFDTSKPVTIRQRLASMSDQGMLLSTILEIFLAFMASLQGFDQSALDPKAAASSYGFDSLSAVS